MRGFFNFSLFHPSYHQADWRMPVLVTSIGVCRNRRFWSNKKALCMDTQGFFNREIKSLVYSPSSVSSESTAVSVSSA